MIQHILRLVLSCGGAFLAACASRPVSPGQVATTTPVITSGPASRVVPIASSWDFDVAATGGDLHYQWRLNGQEIQGANNARYSVRPTSLSEGGVLDVVVRNASGTVTSDTARLRVVTTDGPWRHDLRISSAQSATNFGAGTVWVRQAGVPSLARLPDGRVIGAFQWFPFDNNAAFDQVAVVLSANAGQTWTAPTPIHIAGFPATLQRPFDPTITVTETGQVRLYFTSSPLGAGALRGFYSAISQDGINFTFEPGVRFQPALSTVDCAVTRWNGRWHLVSPVGTPSEGAYHAVSDDGLLFTQLPNLDGTTVTNYIGNLTVADNELRFYGGSMQGLWYTRTLDGSSWSAPIFLSAAPPGGDPAIVEAAPGQWLLVITS